MNFCDELVLKFNVEEFLIHETDYWKWSLRPHQATLGAGILSLKRECLAFSDLLPEEYTDLKNIIKVIELALKKTFNFDVINYLMLMIFDKQVHYHIFPRYKNPLIFKGKEWKDGNWPSVPVLMGDTISKSEAKEIVLAIKNNICSGDILISKKFKVGYTTGVFDLFHIGHLNILKKAKEQCEHLIVGVSTDENVKNYKKKTPIIPFEERIAIVSGLKYVDEVVPQTNMNKFEAWEKLKFNVIFHGDDWKGSNMYEEIEHKFNQVGVEMVYFPYTKGTSSSLLVDFLTQVINDK